MTAAKVFMGIDPGLSGACGLVDSAGSFYAVFDMPVLVTSTGRKQVDCAALAQNIRKFQPAFVLVERVGPRPNEGAASGFSFGMTYGGTLAVLATLGIPHDVVQPAVWKRKAGIPAGSDKQASIQTALRLLPTSAASLTLKKHDGRAEALLLALQAWERRRGGV